MRVSSQPYGLDPEIIRPTPVGRALMVDDRDFRTHLLVGATINDHFVRGVVFLMSRDKTAKCTEEQSTNKWSKVSAVLKCLGQLERTTVRPQIRIIQRNAILQSNVAAYEGTKSGFEPCFSERRLEAGDIVIVIRRITD